MTFEDRWESIWKQSGLPNTAREQIPTSLSASMKQKIAKSKLSDKEIGIILFVAVDKINHGSVVGIEEIIKEVIME